jgi:hypothetical protein
MAIDILKIPPPPPPPGTVAMTRKLKKGTCLVLCGSPLLLKKMAVWHAANFKKSSLNGYYYLQRAVTLNQITQQNSLQRAGGP